MATRLPSEEKGRNESLIGLETARKVLKERVSELRTEDRAGVEYRTGQTGEGTHGETE